MIVGTHHCIGKAIAYLEMRVVTAKLVKTFNVQFSDMHDPEAFWKNMKDQVTMMPGELYCRFENRGEVNDSL
jgi:cytochrome P450